MGGSGALKNHYSARTLATPPGSARETYEVSDSIKACIFFRVQNPHSRQPIPLVVLSYWRAFPLRQGASFVLPLMMRCLHVDLEEYRLESRWRIYGREHVSEAGCVLARAVSACSDF